MAAFEPERPLARGSAAAATAGLQLWPAAATGPQVDVAATADASTAAPARSLARGSAAAATAGLQLWPAAATDQQGGTASYAPKTKARSKAANRATSAKPYHERQVKAECLRHAVNNALGAAVFSSHDFHESAEHLEQNWLARGCGEQTFHDKKLGYYDVQVAHRALRQIGYDLRKFITATAEDLFDRTGVYIVLIKWKKRAHWITVNCRDRRIQDSANKHPQPLTRKRLAAMRLQSEHAIYELTPTKR
jgi:hypothetical protein